MPTARLYLQPSVRQLLGADALSEAQILAGQGRLDSQVQQVVYGFASARAGSLVVARAEILGSQPPDTMKDLAAVVAIQPVAQPKAALAAVGGGGAQTASRSPAGVEVELQQLIATFTQLDLPLILMPAITEAPQVADELRSVFQSEIKRSAARLHAHFVSLVLESGLQELVDELSALVNRPVAVETADFKILASQNMSSTPASQQKTLTESVAQELKRQSRESESGPTTGLQQPLRIGRRLVMPIVLEGIVVGYLSFMLKPNDDHQFLSEYLSPAALAALVDFSHRRKDVSTFTVTQKTLLKDLLSGVTLTAGDQERLEQHYGFDLCDGFIVLVVQVLPKEAAKESIWPQENVAMVEMENNRVFVLPHDSAQVKTWQQHVEGIIGVLKEKRADLKVQVGASRIAASLLDLSDAYREARQSLIIGSMLNPDTEFTVSYGDLGIKRLLYLMLDHPELDRFYEENLGLLEAYDKEWETDLVPTLRIYLQQSANLNSAAKALFIHRHTMRYRLEQIAEILSVDIDSTEVLLNLQIAFLIKDMKGKARS